MVVRVKGGSILMKRKKFAIITLAAWLILNGLGLSFALPGISINLNDLLAIAAGVLLLIDK
jgi:hypothetical protein